MATTYKSVDDLAAGLRRAAAAPGEHDTGLDIALDLVDSRAVSKAVTIQVYRPTGHLQYATAPADKGRGDGSHGIALAGAGGVAARRRVVRVRPGARRPRRRVPAHDDQPRLVVDGLPAADGVVPVIGSCRS